MKIQFTDLYKLSPQKNLIFKKIKTLIQNSNFVGGGELKKFENNFCKFIGTKYCVSLGNGTDALEIAINSLELKKNSEVIIPNNTWISTAEAVVSNNLKVVFCDVNLDDYSICLNDLKKKINKKTSAIIPVHLYGIATNITAIKKIIAKKNIKIIEDCAQAHGAMLKNKMVGSIGDVGCFSFFPGKNLGAYGDGGALVTNSKKIYLKSMRLRNHGALKKYDHKFSGRNSRLDTIQAGILNIKLKNYKKVIKIRNLLANIYFNELKKLKNIELFKLDKKNLNVFHQFVIRTDDRNELKKYLEKNNIQTMIHYPYMLNELKFFKNRKKLIKSYNLGKKILSLPISEEHTEKEIKFITSKIKRFYQN
jgi:dTDP-4-amino-4,6-dideoxygalactose transaminase